MKYQSALALLAGLGLVSASPAAIVFDVNGQPIKPAVEPRDVCQPPVPPKGLVCNADNVLRALRNPTNIASASVFCSGYLQSTITATISAVGGTGAVFVANQTTVPFTTTTTTTQAVVATATIGCEIAGYGRAAPNIYIDYTGIGALYCHELCYQNPDCLSYGYGGTTCALYDQLAENFVRRYSNSRYSFSDKACPIAEDENPASTGVDKLKRQAGPTCVLRPISIPSFVFTATVPTSRYSSACSCIITSALAPCTVSAAANASFVGNYTPSVISTAIQTNVSTVLLTTATTTTTVTD